MGERAPALLVMLANRHRMGFSYRLTIRVARPRYRQSARVTGLQCAGQHLRVQSTHPAPTWPRNHRAQRFTQIEGIILKNDIINTASSAVSKAADDLTNAQEQFRGALALIGELDAQLDSDQPLPKGHGTKVADAQAQAQQLQRLVARREASLSEARAMLAQTEAQAKADRINELGEKLASFDRDEFTATFLEQVTPILDQMLESVYDLNAAERELRSLAGGSPQPTDRVSVASASNGHTIRVDGEAIYSLSPQFVARELGEKLRGSRHEAETNAALAEQRAEQAAEQEERQAELKAQRDAENLSKWGSINPPATVSKTTQDGKVTLIRR